MIYSSLPYLTIFLLLLFLIYPYKKCSDYHRDSIKWMCLLLFVLFFGFHGPIGDDYEAYKSFYNGLASPLAGIKEFEPAFVLIAWSLKLLHLPFWCLLLTCSLFINLLLFRFLWHRDENMPFVLCIFLAMGGVMNEMNFLRSTISLMLFANSITYLTTRQTGKYMAINAIAILFHYSSIIYLPLYFVLNKRAPRKLIVYLMILGFLFTFIHIPFLAPIKYLLDSFHLESLNTLTSYYLSTEMYLGPSLGTLERLLTAFVVWYYYDKLTNTDIGRIAVNGFILFYFCYAFFSTYAMLGIRTANMFVFAYWLLWPLILQQISNSKVKAGVAILMTIYMIERIIGLGSLPQWRYSIEFFTN